MRWEHGKERYDTAMALWKSAAEGDDDAILILLDFYTEYPPPSTWRQTKADVIRQVNKARRNRGLPPVSDELTADLPPGWGDEKTASGWPSDEVKGAAAVVRGWHVPATEALPLPPPTVEKPGAV